MSTRTLPSTYGEIKAIVFNSPIEYDQIDKNGKPPERVAARYNDVIETFKMANPKWDIEVIILGKKPSKRMFFASHSTIPMYKIQELWIKTIADFERILLDLYSAVLPPSVISLVHIVLEDHPDDIDDDEVDDVVDDVVDDLLDDNLEMSPTEMAVSPAFHKPPSRQPANQPTRYVFESIQDPFIIKPNENIGRVNSLGIAISEHFRPYGVPEKLLKKLISELNNSKIPTSSGNTLSFIFERFDGHLHGGNILISKNFALIGTNTLAKNLSILDNQDDPEFATADDVTAAFKHNLNLSAVHWIGAESQNKLAFEYDKKNQDLGLLRQLIEHLDMFITLGGPLDEKESQEIVFLATISKRNSIGVPDDLFTRIKNYLKEQRDKLKNIKTKSNQDKFKIIPIPIILHMVGEKLWYSYNNCILEVYLDDKDKLVRKAYIPQYTAPKGSSAEVEEIFNKANEKACRRFKSAGFSLFTCSTMFDARSRNNGSLHCICSFVPHSQLRTEGQQHRPNSHYGPTTVSDLRFCKHSKQTDLTLLSQPSMNI